MEKETEKVNKTNEREVKISTALYSLLIALFVAVAALGVLIYGFGWNNSLSKKAEKIIPFPAAAINNFNFISIKDLEDNLASVRKFYENQDFSKVDLRVDFTTDNGQKRLKIKEKEILNRMIEDKAVEIIAKKKGITISDSTVSQNVDEKLKEYGTEEDLKNNLSRLYGWSTDDFKNKVVKPDLYRAALENSFNSENPTAAEAKNQIEKAASELDSKKLFSDVAKKYSKGATAQDGGELGWFTKSQLIPDIADATFSLEKGKRSDILESALGFHIIEMEDKKTENGNDLVRLRQIFFPKETFSEYLTGEMKKMKFFVFLKGYSWNQDSETANFKDEGMKSFEQNMIQNSQGDASVLF